MHKGAFFLKWLLFGLAILGLAAACETGDLDKQTAAGAAQDMENRFEGQGYQYFSFDEAQKELNLKSREFVYDNQLSQFKLTELIGKIKSEEDFIYLVAKKGIYDIRSKGFDFTEGVKIVLEKKYLLSGTQFKWDNATKSLTSIPDLFVNIKDPEGLVMQGANFNSNSKQGRFSLEQVTIDIPKKMAENEGLE